MGRRSNLFKERLNRVIPIFKFLIEADNNNAEYHAQLGLAYLDVEPRAFGLDDAISCFSKAIELRGATIQGRTWDYEFYRAVTNIFRIKEQGIKVDESIRLNTTILKDLSIVDENKGLTKAIDECKADGIELPIEDWFHENQDWVKQQTKGQILLDQLQPTAATKPVNPPPTVTQNSPSLFIAPPNTKMQAIVKTYLKKQPIESSRLGDNQKKEVPVGTEYKVLNHSQGTDGHCRVELDHGLGIWYIWSAHWHLPWEDKVLSSVPPSSKNGSALVVCQAKDCEFEGK